MSLKSSEINDYSWIISAVLKSSFCSSSCCQECFPSIVRPKRNFWKLTLRDFLWVSRNQPLHRLLDVLVENGEEDVLLSSKLRTQRENISLVQYQSNSFFSWEWFLMNSQQVPFFVVLLLPLIGMQNPSHSVVALVLQADLQELLCRCCSNPSQIYLIHEKF